MLTRGTFPRGSEDDVLKWADAHHEWHGEWPNCRSGPIPEAAAETWLAVDCGMRDGLRGFPGGSSLGEPPLKRRGVRNGRIAPPLPDFGVTPGWRHGHSSAEYVFWPTGRSVLRSPMLLGESGSTIKGLHEGWAGGGWTAAGPPGGRSLRPLVPRRRWPR